MTLEEQRIAIAEYCGAKWFMERKDFHRNGQYLSLDKYGFTKDIPDYTGSLDAMHIAEKSLTKKQYEKYICRLCDVHQVAIGKEIVNSPDQWIGVFLLTHSTALQRAEAFLETIGKWKGIKV